MIAKEESSQNRAELKNPGYKKETVIGCLFRTQIYYVKRELSANPRNNQYRLSQNYTRSYIWVRNIEMLIFFKNNYFLKSILFKKLIQVFHHVQKVRSKAAIFTSI